MSWQLNCGGLSSQYLYLGSIPLWIIALHKQRPLGRIYRPDRSRSYADLLPWYQNNVIWIGHNRRVHATRRTICEVDCQMHCFWSSTNLPNSNAIAATWYFSTENSNNPCGVEVNVLNLLSDIGLVQPPDKADCFRWVDGYE